MSEHASWLEQPAVSAGRALRIPGGLWRTADVATAGAMVPIVLRRMGQDPATASSIILTTVTGVAGFLSFSGIATLFTVPLQVPGCSGAVARGRDGRAAVKFARPRTGCRGTRENSGNGKGLQGTSRFACLAGENA